MQLQIRIAADAKQAVSALGEVSGTLGQVADSSHKTEQAVSRLKDKFAQMGHIAIAAAVGGGSIAGVTRLADEWNVVAGKMRLAGAALGNFGATQSAVFEMAQRAGARMADLGEVYVSIARGANDFGLSQQRVLGITGNLADAMKIMGGATASTSAAMRQFSQSVASGELRGDELRSVMEQFPALSNAIAQGMGRTVGELRKLAEEGKLSIGEVLAAIEKMGPALARQAEQMPLTFSAGMTKLENAAGKAVAALDKAAQGSVLFNSAMDGLAKNMDSLINVAFVGFAGGIARLVVGLGQGVGAMIAKGKAAHTLAASNLAAAQSEHTLAIAAQRAAAVEAAAAVASAKAAATRAAALLAEANAQRAAAAELVIYGQTRAALERQYASASAAHVAAVNAQAAAQSRASVASSAAAAQVASAGASLAAAASSASLFSRAIGLLGGPLGATITVLGAGMAAWIAWGDAAKSAAMQAVEGSRKVREETVATTKELAKQGIAQIEIQNKLLESQLNRAKEVASSPARKYMPFASLVDIDRLRAMEGELARNKARVTELTTALDDMSTGASSAFRKYVEDADRMSVAQKRLKDLATAQREYNQVLADLKFRFGESSAEYAKYAAQANAAHATEKRAIETKYKNKEGSDALGKSLQTLTQRAREYLAELSKEADLGRQMAQGEKLAADLREAAASKTAKLTQAERENMNALAAQLDQREELNRAMKRDAALQDAIAEQAIAAIERENAAIYARSEAITKWEAEQTQAAQTAARAMEADNQSLAEHVAEIGLTETALLALRQARLDDAIATLELRYAQTDLTDSNLAYLDALLAQIDALKEKKGLLAAGAGKQAAGEELRAQSDLWKDIERTAHDTFVSIFESGKNAFTRLRDTLKNTLYDFLYQMTLKKWVIGIAASISPAAATQAFGSQAVGGAASGISSAASGISSASNLLSAGNFLGSAIGGAFVDTIGIGVANIATSVFGASAGVATGLGAFAATALPVIGAIVAIASLLKKKGNTWSGLEATPSADMTGRMQASGNTIATASSGLVLGETYKRADAPKELWAALTQIDSTLYGLTQANMAGQLTGYYGYSENAGGYHAAGRTMADMDAVVAQFTKDWLSAADTVSATTKTLLASLSGSAEQVLKDSVSILTYNPNMFDPQDAVGQFEAALAQLQAAFDAARAEAVRLGLDVEALSASFQRGAANIRADFNGLIGQAILAITDPTAAAFAALDTEFASVRREASAVGADLVAVEQLYGLKRAQIADAAAQSAIQAAQQAADEQIRIAQQIASERYGLETQLLQARGNTVELRARELAGLDESNRALQAQIWSLGDQAAAAQLAADAAQQLADQMAAIASERYGLETQLLQAQGNTAELRARELVALDESNRALQAQIWAGQDKTAADQLAQQAADEAARAAQQAAEEQARAAEQLRSAWKSLTDTLMDEVRRIRGLLGGGETGKSLAALQADFAVKIAQARAGDQDAAQSLPQLSQAMLALAANLAVSSVDLKRIQARTAASLEQTIASIAGRYGIEVPAFAAGGLHEGGVRLVGENGPELEVTGPARYLSANQTRGLMSGGPGLLDEVRALRAEVAALRTENSAENRAIASASAKAARLIERVMPDGDAMAVRIAA